MPDVPVIHIDLPMGSSALAPAVENLITRGFRYCGWLPGFHEGDVLRMQKLDLTSMSKPNLVTAAAEELYSFIVNDK